MLWYNHYMSETRQNLTAIIYDKRGRILSIGKNSYVKTHPFQAKLAEKAGEPYKQVLHAEVAAIVKCKNLAKAYRISVFRLLRDGTYGKAKPCPICQGAIEAAGIKVIEHT